MIDCLQKVLTTRDLDYNNLASLPKDLLSSNKNLGYLYMRRNPFICCLMIEFQEWASNQTQLNYYGKCTDLNNTIDIDSFNTEECIIPVNGGWCPWLDSSCSVTCGDGVIVRTRTCDNPPPSDVGQNCDGSKTETSHCNLGKCPESCRHSKKGSNNKSEDNLDNKSGKKQRKWKAMNQKRRDNIDWKK
ncbi:properdin-like [Mytilus californianus]|uniref:properdin-like n=1 Tax=Mytilus californianus TaxID=6549 RepID=UPI002247398E|nr:properdin-like [Mytilus californianus]